MKIAFIGLGAMGSGMAGCLLKAGHDLTVYNRTTSKADGLVAKGALRADSAASAARGADIVFSMLFDDASAEQTTFGPDGIADGLATDAIHVACSTISVELAKRMADLHAERRQKFAIATVLGRPPAAEAGSLFTVLGGPAELRSRIMPAVETFSQKVFVAGDTPESSSLVKLSLNFMIMSTIEQMAEVFAINEKAGVSPATMFEIMTNSFYNAPVHKNYGKLLVDRAYENSGAGVPIGLKDTELFLAAGHDLQVPLPFASIARDRFLAAIAAGDGESDFVVIQERVRQDAGLKRAE